MIDATDILSVTKSVTKEWTRQRKAEERSSRSRMSRGYVYSDRVNFTDVADSILPDAYDHASGGGKYSVAKRQLYYACRQGFADFTGRQLAYDYFSSTLLVQYMNRHPETENWKVTADPRGTLTIPNAGHDLQIPCGTIAIDKHLRKEQAETNWQDIRAKVDVEWPSVAAGQRYQAVLYVEKEGFGPLLREAKIAERFDIATLSCKGQSVVAARKYADHVCALAGGVPLLVAHDFDKAGFEISQRRTKVSDWARINDRVAYEFKNDINVIDLGLRLEDVEAYDLQTENCVFKGGFANDSIATKAERLFLKSNRRVELNAFTSPQFLEWIEAKLTEVLPNRLIPSDDVLEKAYRRAVAVTHLNRVIADEIEVAIEAAESATVPSTLRGDLRELIAKSDQPWDRAICDLIDQEAGE